MNEIIKQLNEIALEENWGTVDRVDGKPKAVVVIANAIAEITRLETELRQAKKQDHTKPMTNRQWLESLSDEELAQAYLSLPMFTPPCKKFCVYASDITHCHSSNCKNGVINWLQAKYEKED